MKALKLCKTNIVVANIERVIDESSVQKDLLVTYRNKKSAAQKMLICTKKDRREGKKLPGYASAKLRGEWQSWETALQQAKRLKQDLEKSDAESQDPDESDLLGAKIAKMERLEGAIADLQRDVCITARNERVHNEMTKKYCEWVRNDKAKLLVRSISSSNYEVHQQSFKSNKSFVLSLEDTGIPLIRKELAALPAHARNEAMRAHIYTHLPNMLVILTTFAMSTNVERTRLVLQSLEDTIKRAEAELQTLRQTVGDCLEDTIFQTIRVNSVKAKGPWAIACGEWMLKETKRLSGPTFCAILNNEGVRLAGKGKKKIATGPGPVDWNQQLVEMVQPDIDNSWTELDRRLDDAAADFSHGLEHIHEELGATLKSKYLLE